MLCCDYVWQDILQVSALKRELTCCLPDFETIISLKMSNDKEDVIADVIPIAMGNAQGS